MQERVFEFEISEEEPTSFGAVVKKPRDYREEISVSKPSACKRFLLLFMLCATIVLRETIVVIPCTHTACTGIFTCCSCSIHQ